MKEFDRFSFPRNYSGKVPLFFSEISGKIPPEISQLITLVGSKMNDTFYDGHDELYHHAKFGEDRTMRTLAVGAKMWCLLFLSRFESAAPCVRGVHSSNKHCVAVYCPISTRFTAFSQKGLLF